ncbi:hypothetical protein BM525_08945 [Alteromonas mediterranea]|nr:hypothetical protein BM525_08945 [Alteromonas mediterranea]
MHKHLVFISYQLSAISYQLSAIFKIFLLYKKKSHLLPFLLAQAKTKSSRWLYTHEAIRTCS